MISVSYFFVRAGQAHSAFLDPATQVRSFGDNEKEFTGQTTLLKLFILYHSGSEQTCSAFLLI
ncbi:hypothetical protein ATZ35_14515 [Enterococcus rotai]|uniref:Uncharacterized protein n=1 Tax=Enterococcus rotai TaxID=118060 RepID=A0A0U2WXC5_9ENTE|nr:hypothetical protein ATZ35_14515 [Enterococcus rotai]